MRFKGEGTVAYNKKRNNYEARFSFLDPMTGRLKRKSFSGKTAQEALRRGKKWKQDVENGLFVNFEKCTVWEWLEFWLENYAKTKVREKTYDKYESCLRCYVKPWLGNLPIRKLNGVQVQQLLNKLLIDGGEKQKGISSSTVNATRKYLHSAFDQAQRNGVVKVNVIDGTVAMRSAKREIKILTFEESNRLVEATKTYKVDIYGKVPHMLISLALETGMRFGELIALMWDCIDLDLVNTKGLIYVRRSINTSKPSLHYQEPKTAQSIRQIALMETTICNLKKYKIWQDSQKNLMGDKYHDHGLVLTNLFGNVINPSNFSKRIFKPLLKKVKINQNVRFHDLRHTHASQLLMAGVNPKVIQERLGHSTVAMTLNTYSHLLPSLQTEAIKVLEISIKKSLEIDNDGNHKPEN